MKLDGSHHIGGNVRDLDRAEAIYTDILGFKNAEGYQEEFRHTMLDIGTTKPHLFESPALDIQSAIARLSEDDYEHLAFGTDRKQFPKVIEELKKKNISFQGPVVLGKDL